MAPRKRRNNKNNLARELTAFANGRQIRAPNNPRPIVYRPFNPVTLSVSLTIINTEGSYSMFHTDIITYLAKQLGLGTNAIRIKVQSVRLWNLTSKTMLVYFYEALTDSGTTGSKGNHPLMYISDVGSPTTYPCVGYRYPSTTSNNVVGFGDPQTTYYQVAGVKDDVILHRVHCLYATN
jgi:hypothetical protein